MKRVVLLMPDADYKRLDQARRAAGLTSIGVLLMQKLGFSQVDAVAHTISDQAILRGNLRDEAFVMRDLFTDAEWESYASGDRVRAGRIFCQRVRAGKDGIIAIPKSRSGHQTYCAQAQKRRRSPIDRDVKP